MSADSSFKTTGPPSSAAAEAASSALRATRDSVPCLSHLTILADGEVLPWGDHALGLQPVRDLALLQYDLLAGRGYARGALMR